MNLKGGLAISALALTILLLVLLPGHHTAPKAFGEERKAGETAKLDKEGRMALQEFLINEGYDPGEVDGILGPKTRDALKSYQGKNGLEPTGEPDLPTLKSLGMR